MLGLWRADEVEPQANRPGGAELCVTAESEAQVDESAAQWASKRVEIIQPPTRMDFGYAFVGLDVDGHRLRVFSPVMAASPDLLMDQRDGKV